MKNYQRNNSSEPCRKGFSRRRFLQWGTVGTVGLLTAGRLSSGKAASLPVPRYDKLPQWKGFNLLEKFRVGSQRRFLEEDFKNIHDLGFNFVRLPMDYRCWLVDKNWRKINPVILDEIDEAVHLGEKYGIHICMNFHRAPGWTVAEPFEAKSVWTDPEALEVCAQHWNTFARRFKQYGNEQVSFNLFNEPGSVELDDYLRVHKTLCEAIRSERSDRLIICDGMKFGRTPVLELADLKVAQATRGYTPSEISHYKASWVDSDSYPAPAWPTMQTNGLLLSPTKREVSEEAKKPLTIRGPFDSGTKLRVKVGTVSTRSTLVVFADGTEIYKKEFVAKGGEGEWEKAVFHEKWNVWQNVYNRDYVIDVPDGTKELAIRNMAGDWLTITEIGISSPTMKEVKLGMSIVWNEESSQIILSRSDTQKGTLKTEKQYNRKSLWTNTIVPWLEAQKHGIGVMVGEFGAYNKTPHPIVLAWMNDILTNWHEAGWGWALWCFRGSFGVLDSGRADVQYEQWNGHLLDRKMLDLLQR